MHIFLHIQETIGRTLYRIQEQNYRRQGIYTLWKDGSIQTFKALPTADRSRIQLLRGNFGYGLRRLLPVDATCFTMLRDPLERTLAYYHFARRTPHHYSYHLINENDLSLEAFIHSGQDFMVENAQVRLLANLESGQEVGFGRTTTQQLDEAKRNLENGFAAFGITEAFDASLLLLQRALRWQHINYVPLDLSKLPARSQSVSPATRALLEEVNQLDMHLYDHARALFDEQVSGAGKEFVHEVATFQARNRRRSRLTQLQWELRRVIRAARGARPVWE